MVTEHPRPEQAQRNREAGSRSPDRGRLPSSALVFAAIADPTRRAILDSLRGGQRAAGRIAADFAVSRPAVSRHLRVLAQARLVRVIRQGRNQMYELEPTPLRDVAAWLDGYRTFWAAKLVAIKRLVEDEHGSSKGQES